MDFAIHISGDDMSLFRRKFICSENRYRDKSKGC